MTLHCSFCGKSQHEVARLIAGPTVFICDECVEICEDVIWDAGEDAKGAVRIKVTLPATFNGSETILLSAIADLVAEQYPSWAVVSRGAVRDRNDQVELRLIVMSPSGLRKEEKEMLRSQVSQLSQEISVVSAKYLMEKQVSEKLQSELFTIKADFFDYIRQNSALNVSNLKALRAVLFLDIVGFSTMTPEERSDRLDFLRSVARPLLRNRGAGHLNMWGDGIVCSFEDEKVAVPVALAFVRHLLIEQCECRIGMAWGQVRLAYNDGTERVDYDGEVVNRAARLEPLAEPGEILLSEEFRGIDFSRSGMTVVERQVEVRKAFGSFLPGDSMTVLSVKSVTN